MTNFEFNLSTASANLLRDIRKAIRRKQYEFDAAMLVISGGANIKLGGSYTTRIKKHAAVIRAIEIGDSVKEALARKAAILGGETGYELVGCSYDDNLIPNSGLNFVNDVVFGSASKNPSWYYGCFLSNSDPTASWNSSWGKLAGGLATELAAAQIVGYSTRPQATFANASASQVITTSTDAAITLSAAVVTPISLYGATLNESPTIAYTGTDKILMSATKFSTPKTGLAAADIIHISYSITGSSI